MTVTRIAAGAAFPALAGSHLVGHIHASTADLTDALGAPDNVAGLGDCKTELEWYLDIATHGTDPMGDPGTEQYLIGRAEHDAHDIPDFEGEE